MEVCPISGNHPPPTHKHATEQHWNTTHFTRFKKIRIRDSETIYGSRKTFRKPTNQFLKLKLNTESMDNLGVTTRILDKQPKLRKTKLKF